LSDCLRAGLASSTHKNEEDEQTNYRHDNEHAQELLHNRPLLLVKLAPQCFYYCVS
jgi:hypothetical protein